MDTPRIEKPSNDELAVLYALYRACNGSVHAHVPKEAIYHRLQLKVRGTAKRAFKHLLRRPERLVGIKPTRGGRTYTITQAGIETLQTAGLLQQSGPKKRNHSLS